MYSNKLNEIVTTLAFALFEPRLHKEAETIKDNEPPTIEIINAILATVAAKATIVTKPDLFNLKDGIYLFPCRKPTTIVEVIVNQELFSYNHKNKMTHEKHFIKNTLLKIESIILQIKSK